MDCVAEWPGPGHDVFALGMVFGFGHQAEMGDAGGAHLDVAAQSWCVLDVKARPFRFRLSGSWGA